MQLTHNVSRRAQPLDTIDCIVSGITFINSVGFCIHLALDGSLYLHRLLQNVQTTNPSHFFCMYQME